MQDVPEPRNDEIVVVLRPPRTPEKEKPCTVEGCPNLRKLRGLCRKHYDALRPATRRDGRRVRLSAEEGARLLASRNES